MILTRRICGKAAVQGVTRAALAGLAADAAGAAAGVTLSMVVPEQHKLETFALAVPAADGAIIAFGVVAYLLANGDLKAVLAGPAGSQAPLLTASDPRGAISRGLGFRIRGAPFTGSAGAARIGC